MCSPNDLPTRSEVALVADTDTESKVEKHQARQDGAKSGAQGVFFWTSGMFVCYIVHDALQERIFRLEGFQFGWFMTAAEVAIMLLCGILVERELSLPPKAHVGCSLIGLCITLSHGFGNTALRYSMYPLKVAFKSCKLVPTMWMGLFLTGRKHSWGEYLAALIMCCGLGLLTLADFTPATHETDRGQYNRTVLGPVLLALSTWFDSVVPNLQERLFQVTQAKAAELMFLSNTYMFVLSVVCTTANGEFVEAMDFFQTQPASMEAVTVLALQGVSAYFGLKCYLTVIKKVGGVAGVLIANGRKIITLILSFMLFAKPCYAMHLMGLALVFCGVTCGYRAKQHHKKQQRMLTTHNKKDDGIV